MGVDCGVENKEEPPESERWLRAGASRAEGDRDLGGAERAGSLNPLSWFAEGWKPNSMGEEDMAVSSRGGELTKCVAGRGLLRVPALLPALGAVAEMLYEGLVADGNEDVDFLVKRRCNDGRLTRRSGLDGDCSPSELTSGLDSERR